MMKKYALAALLSVLAASALAQAVPGGLPTVTLATGVQITLLDGKKGAPMPTATSVVKVHYRGTFEGGVNAGKEFDSSYKRGEPATFPLNQVIPCWTEAVQKMSVGSKISVLCPGATAYGPSGTQGIPPNATLRFYIELLEIVR